MSQNIVEVVVKPELPDVIANQAIIVYAPLVTRDRPGMAKFDADQFDVNTGEVSIKSSYLHDVVGEQIGDIVDDKIEAYVDDVFPASISRTINSASFNALGINVTATDTVTQENGDTRTYDVSERIPLEAGRGIKFQQITIDKAVRMIAVGLEKNHQSEVFNDYDNNVVSTDAQYAHVEGRINTLQTDDTFAPYGLAVHVEGYQNYVVGESATHVEGYGNLFGYGVDTSLNDPSVYASHIEGQNNMGRQVRTSHIEGSDHNIVHVQDSHIEGKGHNIQNVSVPIHVEGCVNNLPSSYSEGLHLSGKYANATMPSGFGAAIEVIGNGTSGSVRSNARVTDVNGNVWIAGKFVQEGTPTNNKDLTTKSYVDSKLADMKDYVDDEVSTIPKMSLHIVQTLPTTDIDTDAIYLVPSNGETGNIYAEYMYVNNAWELFGSANVVIPKLVSCSVVTSSVELDNDTHKYTITKTVSETYDDASTNIVSETEVLPFVLSTGLTGTINNGAIVVTAVGAKDTSGGEIFNDYENNQAGYNYAHVEGQNNIAGRTHQHVFGYYNELDASAIEVVGAGTAVTRKNIRTLDTAGNMWVAGKITQESAPVNNQDLATKLYTDSAISDESAILYAHFSGESYEVREYAKSLVRNCQADVYDIWKTIGTLGVGLGQIVLEKSVADTYPVPTTVVVDDATKIIVPDTRMRLKRITPAAPGEVAFKHLISNTGDYITLGDIDSDVVLRRILPPTGADNNTYSDYIEITRDAEYGIKKYTNIGAKASSELNWTNQLYLVKDLSAYGSPMRRYAAHGPNITFRTDSNLYRTTDGITYRTVQNNYVGIMNSLTPVEHDSSVSYYYDGTRVYHYNESTNALELVFTASMVISKASMQDNKIYMIGTVSSAPAFKVYDLATSTESSMSLPQSWSAVDSFDYMTITYGSLYLVVTISGDTYFAVYDFDAEDYVLDMPLPFAVDIVLMSPSDDDILCLMSKSDHVFVLVDTEMSVYGPFVLDEVTDMPVFDVINTACYSKLGLAINVFTTSKSYCTLIPIDAANMPSDASDLTATHIELPVSTAGAQIALFDADEYRDYLLIGMSYAIYGWMPDSNGNFAKLDDLTGVQAYYNANSQQTYAFGKIITVHASDPTTVGDILYAGATDVQDLGNVDIGDISIDIRESLSYIEVKDKDNVVVVAPLSIVFDVPYGENQI